MTEKHEPPHPDGNYLFRPEDALDGMQRLADEVAQQAHMIDDHRWAALGDVLRHYVAARRAQVADFASKEFRATPPQRYLAYDARRIVRRIDTAFGENYCAHGVIAASESKLVEDDEDAVGDA